MNSRLLLQLLARQPRGRHTREGGFAMALSLFVAATVMVGWVALANRSNSSRLGAALQDENREARIAAESGLAVVIDELNRPANRRILVKGQMIGVEENPALEPWNQPITNNSSALVNPCANTEVKTDEKIRPTALATSIGESGTKESYIPLTGRAGTDRYARRFRLVRYELKNADRSTGRNYNPDDVNLRPNPVDTDTKKVAFPSRGVGYVELTVEGQVLRGSTILATSRVTQELQVVPKCCNRSFRGPGDVSRESERSADNFLPGIYGDDNRFCFDDFPQMVLGAGNSPARDGRPVRSDGGLYLSSGSTPNLRNQNDPLQRPQRVLCYTPEAKCAGTPFIDGVPVVKSEIKPPNVPVLSKDGIPCEAEDIECQKKGINAAKSLSSRSIELINRTTPCSPGEQDCQINGAKTNSATDKFAKDYIRVNGKNIEICNKEYYNPNDESIPKNPDYAATANQFDKSPKIVEGSCETLYDHSKPNDSKNVCARQEIDGFVSYHCRIKNIFVNDFDGKTEANALANNTLFIDSTGNSETKDPRINLHINEDWAKTKLPPSDPNSKDPIRETMNANGDLPSTFSSIYTVGGYNDGQIQHVNCGNSSTSSAGDACLTRAKPEISTRAAIVSACKRKFNENTGKVDDLCDTERRSNTVSAQIGDDGYMRGMFIYAPYSTISIYGDPTFDSGWDKEDLDQGRPQMAAAVWAHRLRFVYRTTELYIPGVNAEFFGMETSNNDRYTPTFTFDYVARGTTGRSLFQIPKDETK
jgi:hypothetical protein